MESSSTPNGIPDDSSLRLIVGNEFSDAHLQQTLRMSQVREDQLRIDHLMHFIADRYNRVLLGCVADIPLDPDPVQERVVGLLMGSIVQVRREMCLGGPFRSCHVHGTYADLSLDETAISHWLFDRLKSQHEQYGFDDVAVVVEPEDDQKALEAFLEEKEFLWDDVRGLWSWQP